MFTDGLKSNIASSLIASGYRSKEEVIEDIESGNIRRHSLISDASRKKICQWAGAKLPRGKIIHSISNKNAQQIDGHLSAAVDNLIKAELLCHRHGIEFKCRSQRGTIMGVLNQYRLKYRPELDGEV